MLTLANCWYHWSSLCPRNTWCASILWRQVEI